MKTEKLFGKKAVKHYNRFIVATTEVIVGVIMIPIVQAVIESANLTGLTATILTFVSVFLAIGVLIAGLSTIAKK